jgi:hypothetical protein
VEFASEIVSLVRGDRDLFPQRLALTGRGFQGYEIRAAVKHEVGHSMQGRAQKITTPASQSCPWLAQQSAMTSAFRNDHATGKRTDHMKS